MVKKIIYWTIIVLMVFPLLQYALHVVKVKPLDGAFYLAGNPKFTMDSWLSGKFQDGYVNHIEDNIGFREYFIRLNNQVYYSLFNMAKSPGAVVGKNKQLYLHSYFEGYFGYNFSGKENIDLQLKRYKFIQDYFSLYGKTTFMVFAPGKTSFYPEYFPDEYDIESKSLNNFEYYISQCEELGIDHVDLNSYFTQLKGKTKYELYPQNGVHWTSYGMYLGIDSIIRYIEKKQNINIPDIEIKSVRITDTIIPPDNDVEVNMNLLFPIAQPPQVYPEFEFHSDSSFQKPKVIMISDSYYWQAYGERIPHNCFQFGGFWFYFKTAYAGGDEKGLPIEKIDVKAKMLESDVIILMGTEATSHMFPYGFIDKAFDYFIPKSVEERKAFYQWKIQNESDWLESTKTKAEERGNTLEEQIKIESAYLANLDYNNLSQYDKWIAQRYNAMIHDSTELSLLMNEASKLGIDYKSLALFKAEQKQ